MNLKTISWMAAALIAGAVAFEIGEADGAVLEKVSFDELIEARHSGRSYDASKSVPVELWGQLAQAASFSPSSYNEQPWRFIFCDRLRTPREYEKALSCLMEANQEWAKKAPMLIIVASNSKSSRSQTINQWAPYDTGAAAMSLVYMATSMGLMAHQMGGFYADKVRKEFAIPEDFVPMSVIALGYESAKDASSVASKQRHPIGKLFYLGTWGKELPQ